MSCCKESQTHQPWGWAGLLLSQQSCTVWGELLRGILLSSKTLFFILLYLKKKTNKQIIAGKRIISTSVEICFGKLILCLISNSYDELKLQLWSIFQFVFHLWESWKRSISKKSGARKRNGEGIKGKESQHQMYLADSCSKVEEEGDHGDAVVLRGTCLYQGLGRMSSDGFGLVWFERRKLPKGWIWASSCRKLDQEFLLGLKQPGRVSPFPTVAGKEGADGNTSQGLNPAQSKQLLFMSFSLSISKVLKAM